jgi:3-hydroxyacyl-[acyl-carrier-protein] dehydratase|tara:strand:+ start:379 stop:834 length:456 start_codon:yes stop_codon:yes gene_type:complete
MAISLNKKEILEYQKNRDPYLFLDEVTELQPGKFANGFKDLNPNEWFFKVHWPGDENMPGMLQIEALVQLCALTILSLKNNKGKIVYLTNVDKVRFFKKVLPNQRYEMKTILHTYKRGMGICSGEAFINNKIVCKAEFRLLLPNISLKVEK